MSLWQGKGAVIAIPAMVATGVCLWLYFSPGSLSSPDRSSTGQSRTQRFAGSAPKAHDLEASDWSGTPLSPENLPKLSRTAMSHELARALLERAKTEITGIENRADFSAGVLSALAKQGHWADAWALVEAAPGLVRERQLATLFREDPAPVASLMAKLEGLTSEKERGLALKAIIGTRPKDAVSLDFDQIKLNSQKEMGGFSEGISEAIAAFKGQDPKKSETAKLLLKKCIDLAAKGALDYPHLVRILNLDSTNDGFLKWELLAGLESGKMPAASVANLQSFVAGHMVTSDPERAMSFLCSGSSNPSDPGVLGSAITYWYKNDSKAAGEWITRHAENLAPAAGDGIKGGVIQLSVERGEFATAREWAALIVDATRKEHFENLIRKTESPDRPEDR